MFNQKKNRVEFELIWIDRTDITCSVQSATLATSLMPQTSKLIFGLVIYPYH